MAAAEPLILCTGANGRFAHLIIPELRRRGARVRALLRKPEKADDVRRKGASEIAIGDLRQPASLDAALSGVSGVFYIAPGFEADEAQLGLNMVAAAQRAKVQRFVFSSVVHPTLDLPNHIAKPPVESALYASQLEFVVLHPANFFQNLLGAWPSVLEEGVIAGPFSKWARISRVDYRDVAEVAAIALTSDRLAYGTYELCAHGRLNREDIAQIASEVLGRKIEAAEPAFDKWAAQAKLPFDDRKKRLLQKMYEFVGTHGELANSLTLRATLGREPRTMRQFIQELAGRAAAAAS